MFIKKCDWIQICADYPYFNNMLKKRALNMYIELWQKINSSKNKEMDYYRLRSDYKHIIALLDNNENDLDMIINSFDEQN